MAAVALIVLTQGPNTDIGGRAVIGTLTDGACNVANDNNVGVASWSIELLDVPPNSALVPGVLNAGTSPTPNATFTPDVPGTYRIRLIVNGTGGETDVDIRCFGVRNVRGFIVPPYQKNPDPLPLTGTGSKPDEQNYGGQARGWTGSRTSGGLEQHFETYDDLQPRQVTATPFSAGTTNQAPLFYIDLITIGSNSVFNLPSGALVGRRYRVLTATGSPYSAEVFPPGGHTIDGQASVVLTSGEVGMFVYLGGTVWVRLRQATDASFSKTTADVSANTPVTTTLLAALALSTMQVDVYVNAARGTFESKNWHYVVSMTWNAGGIRQFNAGAELVDLSPTPAADPGWLTSFDATSNDLKLIFDPNGDAANIKVTIHWSARAGVTP